MRTNTARHNYGPHAVIVEAVTSLTYKAEVWVNCKNGNTDLNPMFRRVELPGVAMTHNVALQSGEAYLKMEGLIPWHRGSDS